MALNTEKKRKAAMDIVIAEEQARGCVTALPGSWTKEKEHGCDILSTAPGAFEPSPVEVKAWGQPLLTPTGKFTYGQDIRASQYQAAHTPDDYRLEIVANLDSYLEGGGGYERLTITASDIRERAMPRSYDVPLAGLEGVAFRAIGVDGEESTAPDLRWMRLLSHVTYEQPVLVPQSRQV